MVTTSHTLIAKQAHLPAGPSIAAVPGADAQKPTLRPTPAGDIDAFPMAVRVMSQLRAHEHRATNPDSPHRPVPADTVAAIAALLPGVRNQYSDLPTLDEANALADRIARLSPRDLDLFMATQALDRVKWRALQGPQAEAFELAAHVDVLGLGGGAGSSKTECAIGIALYQQRTTRILRRTAGEFASILTRVGEIVGSVDGRNLGNNAWHLDAPYGFREQGAGLEWVGLNDQEAVLKLQGRPCSALVVDDAASGGVSKVDYEFARNWLRHTDHNLHKLTIFTMNPATSSEGLWLRDEMFAPWISPSYEGTPARSGEIRWFLRDGDTEREVPQGTPGALSRSLVLSNVTSNLYLMRAGYANQLAQAPSAVLRDRLLHGDFSAGWDNDDDQQVIPAAWVQAAMDRWKPAAPAPLDTLGVDVARGGKDRTAITKRCGDWFSSAVVLSGEATATGQKVAAAVLAARGSSKHAVTFIDVTGVGASPYDILREKVPTVPVIFGASYKGKDASQSFEFTNVRSALWWRMREALDPNSARKIALPPDRVLKAELCMPRYELRGGKLFVESRDDIIKRLKRSPDVATAYVLALIDTNSTIARPANKLARWAAGQLTEGACQ